MLRGIDLERKRRSDISLIEQLNYENISCAISHSGLRVVYAKAGTFLRRVFCVDQRRVIDTCFIGLKPPARSKRITLPLFLTARPHVPRFRCAITWPMGRAALRQGDVYLPIPGFDPRVEIHNALAAAAAEANDRCSLRTTRKREIPACRKLIRDALTEVGIARRISQLVAALLDELPANAGGGANDDTDD